MNWNDTSKLDQYDIIHFHKGLANDMQPIWNAIEYCKEHNIVTIMDIDDNWEVGQFHPLFLSNKAMKAPEKITETLRRVDYVTTTTEIFANKIRKLNKNVFVYPNAIDPNEEQYLPIKNPSDRIRFGFVMGSSHERDMEQFKGVVNSLGKDILNNKLYVAFGDSSYLYSTSCILKNINILVDGIKENLTAQIKYHGESYPCKLVFENNNLRVDFINPAKCVTPGQTCVIYSDNLCIGSGTICKVLKDNKELWYLK